MSVFGRTWSTTVAPLSGLYVPVPALNDAGGPLVIDMNAKGFGDKEVQILCEITDDQAASSDPREGVYYVFAKTSSATFAGLPGDYKTDDTVGVPDAIGIGFTAREVAPLDAQYLLLMSRTAFVAEVRIRAI